jgi:hypothetical protein
MTIRIRRAISFASLTALLLLGGCTAEPAEPYDPERGRGAIDRKLPAEQRAQQAALARLLEAFRQGIHPDDLQNEEPDLVLKESDEQFYADGARVLSWDWARPPHGNQFFVKLTMQKDEPGLVTVDVERVYQVERQGSTFGISRSRQ